MKVPFTKPCFTGKEEEHLLKILHDQSQLSGGGIYNKKCEKLLTAQLGSPTLLTTSCTHSLELAGLLSNIGPGDEFISPSFTFVSTVNAFLLRGATPVFVDNDQFGNIDLDALEKTITKKTKLIVVVHYAGSSCDMDRLVSICNNHGIFLVEDAAQCAGATYNGKSLGTFGQIGCISFHDTKNITSGEGGALIVNDKSLLQRAEILREKGTNRSQFLQGLVDKYTWVDIGSSYVLSELNAAFLYPQIENVSKINHRRQLLWARYELAFRPSLKQWNIEMLEIPPKCKSNFHTFGFIFKDFETRSKFIAHMRSKEISTPFHYVALHTSPFGKKYIREGQSFKNCMKFSDGLARLPLYYNMTTDEQDYVIEQARNFF